MEEKVEQGRGRGWERRQRSEGEGGMSGRMKKRRDREGRRAVERDIGLGWREVE